MLEENIKSVQHIQLAKNNNNMWDMVASQQADSGSVIVEGLMVKATGIGVVFALLEIMIIFINIFKKVEHSLDKASALFTKKANSEDNSTEQDKTKEQNIDNTTLILISAAVAAYTHNKASIRRIRVLPTKAKQGGNWAMQARSALQSSHSGKK